MRVFIGLLLLIAIGGCKKQTLHTRSVNDQIYIDSLLTEIDHLENTLINCGGQLDEMTMKANDIMTLYEFNALKESDKYLETHTKGTYLDMVEVGSTRYVLYSLHRFWVQITYDMKENKQIEIKSFLTGGMLDRFSHLPKEL